MGAGSALKEARIAVGLTQGALARDLFVSDSLVSDWERGRARVPRHMTRQVIKKLPKARVVLRLAHEVLGKAFVSPELNRVDRHLASMIGKAEEELQEILERSPVIKKAIFREDLNADDRQTVWDWALDMLDGRTIMDNTLVAICDRCGFDPERLFEAHWKKVQEKGYYDPGR